MQVFQASRRFPRHADVTVTLTNKRVRSKAILTKHSGNKVGFSLQQYFLYSEVPERCLKRDQFTKGNSAWPWDGPFVPTRAEFAFWNHSYSRAFYRSSHWIKSSLGWWERKLNFLRSGSREYEERRMFNRRDWTGQWWPDGSNDTRVQAFRKEAKSLTS